MMAYPGHFQDATKDFTITLTALLEGLATIKIVYFDNLTSGAVSSWAPGRDWTNPIEAVEGDSIRITISVQNDGSTIDTMWVEFYSLDVGPNEEEIRQQDLDVGSYASFNWTFTMPPANVNIILNAGHIEY